MNFEFIQELPARLYAYIHIGFWHYIFHRFLHGSQIIVFSVWRVGCSFLLHLLSMTRVQSIYICFLSQHSLFLFQGVGAQEFWIMKRGQVIHRLPFTSYDEILNRSCMHHFYMMMLKLSYKMIYYS